MGKAKIVLYFTLLAIVGVNVQGQRGITDSNSTTHSTTKASTITSEHTTTTDDLTSTSTEEPTTAPTTTATSTTSTTTITPTTKIPTTPAPSDNYRYNVTENNVTCIMVAGDILFSINYTTLSNTTLMAKISIPKSGASVSGNCHSGEQKIALTWGKAKQNSSSTMTFSKTNKTVSDSTWTISSFVASIFIDETFVNSSNYGDVIDMNIDLGLTPMEIAVNHSFNCFAHLHAKNVTANLASTPYELPIIAELHAIQIQAFNEIPDVTNFVDAVHCTADEISDIVPIAVGCALAGLVVIVLIAYLVGRRRRSAAYQSV